MLVNTVNYVQCAHCLIQPRDHNWQCPTQFDAFTGSVTRPCLTANICFSRFTQSRMKYAWCINDTLDVHDVILHIVVIIQSREFCELGAPRGDVHVRLRSLEWTALWSGLEGLDNVLTVVLVYRGKEGGREREREREGKHNFTQCLSNHYIRLGCTSLKQWSGGMPPRKFIFSEVEPFWSKSCT